MTKPTPTLHEILTQAKTQDLHEAGLSELAPLTNHAQHKDEPLHSVSISTMGDHTTVEYRFGEVLDTHKGQKVIKLKNVDNANLNRIAALCNNRFHTAIFYFIGGPVWTAYISQPITQGEDNWCDWSAQPVYGNIRPRLTPDIITDRLLGIMDTLMKERS